MKQPIDLVFLWHMHQPDYRDHCEASGENTFALPWVYLHGIKDYTDMAAHLERHQQIRAVVNASTISIVIWYAMAQPP